MGEAELQWPIISRLTERVAAGFENAVETIRSFDDSLKSLAAPVVDLGRGVSNI